MIYVFLATGFEDIEALAPVDILRRAGLQVETVSITGEEIVTSAHGVGVVADTLIEAVDFEDAEMIVLPGGMPGASNLDACEVLRQGILSHCKAGKPLAAICAAPLVAAAMEFGYTLAEWFVGKDAVKALRNGMIYTQLMSE